jgi:hypothetical protein
MEHRCGQRIRLNAPASVTDGSGWTAFVRVRDISASGAYLECSVPRAGVTHVIVRLKGRRVGTLLAGDVIRRTPDGIGIEWGAFAPAAVAPLLQGAARVSDSQRHPVASPRVSRGNRAGLHRTGSQIRRDRRPPRS